MRHRSSLGNSCAIEKKSRGEEFELAGMRGSGRGRKRRLEHLVPLALIFKHDFTKKADGRHAVIQQLVMKFLQ